MTNKLTLESRAMIAASSFCLCETLPLDFESWGDDDLNAFVEDNAWEPFAHQEAKELWKNIANLAGLLQNFHKQELENKD